MASSGLRLGVGAHWPFLHDPGRCSRDDWGRPSLADLHRDLREITTQVRFDADLAARDVRSAWERGERSRFYPYASSFEHAIAEMGVSGGSWR